MAATLTRQYERAADRVGRRYGKFLCQRLVNGNPNARYEFKCDCGKVKRLLWAQIHRDGWRDCGCESQRNDGRSSEPTYQAWKRLIDRCHNSKAKGYDRAGALGHRVCKRWQNYRRFLTDIGPKPGVGYSLVLNDGETIYEPGSCRWLSLKETRIAERKKDRKNRRWHTVFGIRLLSTEWSEICGITRERMRQRFRDHSPEEAVCIYPHARKWLLKTHGVKAPEIPVRIPRYVSKPRPPVVPESELPEVVKLMQIADAEPTRGPAPAISSKRSKPSSRKSRSKFSKWDGVVSALLLKGFLISDLCRWFALHGIYYSSALLGQRIRLFCLDRPNPHPHKVTA